MNALVTGGTKGIGFAICNRLLDKGYNLGFCARNEEDVERLELKWTTQYPDQQIVGVICDMSEKDEVLSLGKKILQKFGAIQILINNAGIFLPGEIVSEPDLQLETMINTNLYSAYHLTRIIVPSMIENKNGHIFNMCSIASMIAYPNGGSYSISKFALLGFSKVLREELKDKGVKVTSILPGATWSHSWKDADLPRERLCEADDVAIAVESAIEMSSSAVMEEIIIRPQLGDL